MPAGAPTRARPATPAKIADRNAQWRTGPTYPYPLGLAGALVPVMALVVLLGLSFFTGCCDATP